MHKFYKQRLYKKYNDEIWGSLVASKKFSYNKRSILLYYKNVTLRSRLKIKTKFNYFRRGFLKHLNQSLLQLKTFKKKLRLISFNQKRWFSLNTSSNSSRSFFSRKKRRVFFKKNKAFFALKFNLSIIQDSRFWDKKTSGSPLSVRHHKNFLFKRVFPEKKLIAFKSVRFLRANNLKFIIKKKLNLRREKTFFYSVHIAAPRKKTKKWSLFALKNIYYKKISLFFGFKKIAGFLKLYEQVKASWGKNESVLFLFLECRLENFLFRLNFFPSIYFIKRFILSNNVFVNNKSINYSSYLLNYNEIVSVNKKYLKFVYYTLKRGMKRRKFFLNSPSFIEVDYKLLVAMLIRAPDYLSLTRPVSFDLYTRFPSFNR